MNPPDGTVDEGVGLLPLPCPWGHPGEAYHVGEPDLDPLAWGVCCSAGADCPIFTAHMFDTREEAIADWNRLMEAVVSRRPSPSEGTRGEGLEEAAKVCDRAAKELRASGVSITYHDVVAARALEIRALIGRPATPPAPLDVQGETVEKGNRMEPLPGIGEIVQYRLTSQDAVRINDRREELNRAHDLDRFADGYQRHVGNKVSEGDTVALIVTRVFPSPAAINGQAILDGTDSFWVGSVAEGTGPRTWSRVHLSERK